MAHGKWMKIYEFCIFILLFCTRASDSTILDRTNIIIMSQKAHGQSGMKLRDHLHSLLKDAGVDHPKLLLLHKDLPIHGSWTIFPILSKILHRFETSIDWFVFVDERSSIDAITLSSILDSHNATKNIFLGRHLIWAWMAKRGSLNLVLTQNDRLEQVSSNILGAITRS